ncbi:MAG: integration host factor, alpha subunit [Pseudomonadota bacterium]|jgi:integration host factor subunit alpha
MNQSSPSDLGPDLALEARERDLAASLGVDALRADEGFTLTKAELAEMLFERVGLNKREAKDMVETFFDEIRDALERGESVKLSGFGNFQLRDKPQRPGRNPKTGEEIPISARRVVTFHASQKLKALIERLPQA